MRRRVAWVIALCGLALICGRGASASDLAGRIETLFGKVGIEGVNIDSKGIPHNAHFGSESFKTFSLLVKNLSATAAKALATAGSAVALAIDHPSYRHEARLGEPSRESLAQDLQ